MSEDKNQKKYKRPATPSDYRIDWNDIDLAAKYGSEYQKSVLKWVRNHLGYVPHEGVLMPYMAMAQSIIKNAVESVVPLEITTKEFLKLARSIRRDDMFKGDWVKSILNPYYQTMYDSELKEYKQKARDRLCTFIEYEIQVEHSFLAEIYLRNMFTFENYHEGMRYCNMDMKAATIALYHEAYHTEGPQAAYESILFGLMYEGLLLEDED